MERKQKMSPVCLVDIAGIIEDNEHVSFILHNLDTMMCFITHLQFYLWH